MSKKMDAQIRVRMDAALKSIVQDAAERTGLSVSAIVRDMLCEHIDEYMDPSPEQERYMEIQSDRIEEDLHKTIAHRHIEEATFMPWMVRRCREMYHRDMSEEEVARWVALQFPVAEKRGCRAAAEELHKAIEEGRFTWTADDREQYIDATVEER